MGDVLKGVRGAAAVVLIGFSLGACAGDGASTAPAGPAAAEVARVIRMTADGQFSPVEVRVLLGQAVEWQNTSPNIRSVKTTGTPNDGQPFDSGRLNSGATFRHTFTVPGIYRYVSEPGERGGMAGIITVDPR